MSRWIVAAFSVALICMSLSMAHADSVASLSKRLAKSKSDKVRISAVLSLAKSNDKRAVRAMARALSNDRSSAIRRIAAGSLGQKLKMGLDRKTRDIVVATLKSSAANDRDSKVRDSAKVALVKAGMSGERKRRRGAGVLVAVSSPKKTTSPKSVSIMQKTIKKVIKAKAPSYVRTAPGTGMPSSAQLKRSGVASFSVEPNVSKIKLTRRGSQVVVRCEVRVRLFPWAARGESIAVNKTATVTGAGSVTSGSSKSSIASSSDACIEAVVSQVTSNQIVPFLVARAH
jgi:hypothetical protein